MFLSGLYLILAAVASYGFGGYVAGRVASRFESTVDAEFRDGMHGILMWALAALILWAMWRG